MLQKGCRMTFTSRHAATFLIEINMCVHRVGAVYTTDKVKGRAGGVGKQTLHTKSKQN